jgi:hypothetical protein
MGYRSNVGMIIQAGDDKQKFREMLALLKVEGVLTEMEKEWNDDEWGYNDEQFAFYVEDVKWYDSFRAIKLVEEIWERFEDALPDDQTDELWSGMFCRIGEDATDVEEKYMGYSPPFDELQINRYIEMDRSALGMKGNTNETA